VLALTFVLTIISGACATIHHRIVKYLVVVLAVLALTVELMTEFAPVRGALMLNTLSGDSHRIAGGNGFTEQAG
jgi:hypothetical protein